MSGSRASRLGRATLGRLPAAIAPAYDPAGLEPGIVHIGLGAFARGHVAAFTHDAIAAGGHGWGITGIAPSDSSTVERLRGQDGLYALLARGPDGDRARVMAPLVELVSAAGEPDRASGSIAAEATRVVTLTVTERGYPRDGEGRLDHEESRVAADLGRTGEAPRSALGILRAGLERRARSDSGPLTVLSCDNLPRNGPLLRSLLADFCRRAGDDERLLGWIDANVRFPATVVDRIVPAAGPGDGDAARAAIGLEDREPVVAEPFRSWVLEDDFAAARPRWEDAGAEFVADARPHEELKLRVLNGAHSMLAALGLLDGRDTVAAAISSEAIAGAVRELIARDVEPTLAPPAGVDVAAFTDSVLGRWSNPRIEHRLAQIAAGSAEKLRLRLAPPARERAADGAETPWIDLAIAACALVDEDLAGGAREPDAIARAAVERIGLGDRGPGRIAEGIAGLLADGVVRTVARW